MSKTKTEQALDKYTVTNVRNYRDEHVCSLQEAQKKMIDLTISEALEHAYGWQDLKAIMQFQHTYRRL